MGWQPPGLAAAWLRVAATRSHCNASLSSLVWALLSFPHPHPSPGGRRKTALPVILQVVQKRNHAVFDDRRPVPTPRKGRRSPEVFDCPVAGNKFEFGVPVLQPA